MAIDFVSVQKSTACAPTSAFPLDARSYFESYDLAVEAAASAAFAGDTNSIYYFGQTLVVVTTTYDAGSTKYINADAKLYIIVPEVQADGTLKGVLSAVGTGGDILNWCSFDNASSVPDSASSIVWNTY